MQKWRRRKPPKHGDVIVVGILTVFFVAMVFFFVTFEPIRDGRQGSNFGLPPDFQCNRAGLDPTAACVKKPSPFPSR